ncbi:MAG TPA: DUF502 domain-containing protein [Kaistella chaponensis]|jgi:uncharacterized membrane protein|uniref:Uncharacterized membrane protein n=1 Tax=Kaistella chaponensis TaxID=713588 RepID=A0A1N7LEK2_9FLAO|nr:DUF502 domain-containing protein [Kaistella chaponensis]SIS72210.1 Uncharacterized membrane protein [Kaistella chaponensis]HPW89464.1 DUF502 domain-containing protein [Kaistella chaponensis]HQC07404.1 DUF502 domain-containing protein [Kaistella chaponensis]
MNRKQHDRILNTLAKSFFQGLLIIGPFALTIWIIWYIVSSIDNIIPTISERTYPGITFLIVIISTTLIGYLGNKFIIGRVVVDSFDYLLEHTPGIKFIYTSLKDVMTSFVGDKKKFNKPVLIKTTENPAIWRIGFLTQSDLSSVGFPNYVSVYLPHSYAVSGWVVFVLATNITILENVSAAQAMKFAVSGGVAGFHSDDNVFKAPE